MGVRTRKTTHVEGGGAPEADLSALTGKYMSITTFRRDDSPVATPVWFVRDFERLLVETEADSFKVRRIRRNPHVIVAPCSARGKIRGLSIEARAQILSDLERPRAERLLGRKYRVDGMIIRPIRWIQSALHARKARGTPMILAIVPEQAAVAAPLRIAA